MVTRGMFKSCDSHVHTEFTGPPFFVRPPFSLVSSRPLTRIMSASQSPELSDIHPGPTTVAETLQVSTEPAIAIGTTSAVSDSHGAIPAVGASISVPEPSAAGIGSVERSSTALLNPNSLSLTEILNAQQQALEQFQCQLQLAQQTEAINQRMDAIERTLNTLIQQKAQEDAEKQQKQQQEQAAAEQQAAAAQQEQGDRLASTPSRASQVPPSPNDLSDVDKKRKLPRELCAKVRSTYHSLNLEFKIDERFLSPANQRVTDTLIDTVYNDTNGLYSAKDIKRATHRYYESRRRLGIEEMPDRQEKAAEQRKKRKYRARQQRAYDRRRKFVRDSEVRYWENVTPACMTEESDSENGEKIVLHSLLWRSEFLNQFVHKLDNRYERSLKTTKSSTVKRDRVMGLASASQPPTSLPGWMIDPNYKRPTPLTSTPTVCMEPAVDPDNPSLSEDVTTYTSLISGMQDVRDDSSDFELPESIVT